MISHFNGILRHVIRSVLKEVRVVVVEVEAGVESWVKDGEVEVNPVGIIGWEADSCSF